ncbi:MAG TPA: Flp pilus assembly complex ATPase component TadA [Candidatus Faecimonas gallistercoris]|nr:Flp pilus assembly complex ATPase component TadA [Candidatus Faecimonas gallistercoris]
MNENIFDKLDFGPLRPLLENDEITDISFDNNGQIWVRSLTQGSLRVEVEGLTPEFVEKLAFQCSNVMGTTFNNAKPFLDAESAELRLNFVHPSIATNGIAMVIRKTPAKIRLEKEKLLKDDYFTQDIHDILIKCVEGHCNIIVCGETGSGKTEFVKYLASHTRTDEKIITIEDTLELHLDRIFPQRDIVAMKTNNVASYTDVLVTCMRQNPKWILLSEVRSAEAVSAVRNSISSGHNILSTIHADKASAIPYRMYSLMETDLDVNQFLNTIYRYIQIGVHIKAYYSKEKGKFHREVDEVCEFYVDENNKPQSRIIYQKLFGQEPVLRKPSPHLIEYLENQNIDINSITDHLSDDLPFHDDLEREKFMETHTDTDTGTSTDTDIDNVVNTKSDNIAEVSIETQPVEVPSVTVTPSDNESAPSVIPTVVSSPVNTSTNSNSNVHLELPKATPTVVSIPTVPKVNTTPTPIPTISVGNNISAGNVSSPGDSQSSVDFSSLGSLE